MFRSTFGYASSHRLPGTAGLCLKAVDFEHSLEVFQVGQVSGEDVPFQGAIFCFRSPSASLAFVYAPEAVLGRVDLARFDRSTWHGSRQGSIQVVAGAVFDVGLDLRAVETGPRGRLLLDPGILESLGVGRDAEAAQALPAIRAALPVLRFDSHGPLGPSPAICISVQHARTAHRPASRVEDEALAVGARLLGEANSWRSSQDFISHLQALAAAGPLRLERLFAEVLDAERTAFTHGADSVVRFSRDEEFWQLLRASYDTYYRDHCDCFERFLLSVVGLIDDRLLARRLFEEGLGRLLGPSAPQLDRIETPPGRLVWVDPLRG